MSRIVALINATITIYVGQLVFDHNWKAAALLSVGAAFGLSCHWFGNSSFLFSARDWERVFGWFCKDAIKCTVCDGTGKLWNVNTQVDCDCCEGRGVSLRGAQHE